MKCQQEQFRVLQNINLVRRQHYCRHANFVRAPHDPCCLRCKRALMNRRRRLSTLIRWMRVELIGDLFFFRVVTHDQHKCVPYRTFVIQATLFETYGI